MFKVAELIAACGGKIVHAGSCMNVSTVSTDSRSIRKDEAFLAIQGINFDGHSFLKEVVRKGVGCVIVQKGCVVPRGLNAIVIEVADTTVALGDIARFHRRRFSVPVIAITGSNGKTTAKDMLAWILSGVFKTLKNEGTQNNHIGVPRTLLKLDASHECAVIELGTNHFGEISYLSKICEPTIAAITNIGPSHLEYFKDLSGVYKEKLSVLKSLTGARIGILNADDPFLKKAWRTAKLRPFLMGFGIDTPCDFQARDVKRDLAEIGFSMHRRTRIKLATPGIGNVYNALCAIAASRTLGVYYPMIASRLKSFVFPTGRLTMRVVDEVRFIDDTYNANPLSMAQAMDALRLSGSRGRRVLVMGDMLELGSETERFHRDAGARAAESCDIFITVGRHSLAAARSALAKGFDKASIFSCANSVQARDVLFKKIAVRKNDIVLLKGSRGMKLEQVLNPV
jgi:UDP-N-acetylmuramoyl-tripeptide--D-alanyl-D-alanine ligase